MLVALLTACLISAPTTCRVHEILLAETMPVTAYLEAQTRAAEWLQDHPGMTMTGLRVVSGRGV